MKTMSLILYLVFYQYKIFVLRLEQYYSHAVRDFAPGQFKYTRTYSNGFS